MSSALTQLELGEALSSHYTVYLFSRRGRGLSGPYPQSLTSIGSPLSKSASSRQKEPTSVYDPAYSAKILEVDLDDLATFMRHTKATYLLGISGGALLILAACLPASASMPPIQKAVVFEPPLLFNTLSNGSNGIEVSGVIRYEKEMEHGDVAGALITAMLVAQLGPGWLRACPRWIIRILTKMILHAEAKDQAKKRDEGGREEGAVTMEALAPALRYDFALIEAVLGSPERFKDVTKAAGREILLLGGQLSMPYIHEAMKELERVMKNDEGTVKRVEVKGAGHELLENKIRNGKVEKAIETIKEFLEGSVRVTT
jgi:pimeloyl-ACP methyl ester carboxylesterase